MNVKIKLLRDGARLPERKTDGAAGYDLYLPETTVIQKGRNVLPLGFAMQMPTGWMATIRPRSGFSAKGFYDDKGCGRYDADQLLGTIDCDFVGEVCAIVKSCEPCPFIVKKGTRIAQMIFQRYLAPEMEVVQELDTTERGDGGFGHTGTGSEVGNG